VEYILGQYWRHNYLAIVNIINDVQINGKPHLSQIKYNASGVLIGGVFANGELLKGTYDTSGNPTGTALAIISIGIMTLRTLLVYIRCCGS
jgi:hypothetical protein